MTELLGLQEIAQLAGVSTSAVANWRARDATFPKPTATLAGGPVFNGDTVRAWLKNRDGSASGERKKCFVIGPIGNELAPTGHPDRLKWEAAIEVWEKVVEPACLTCGLDPFRADQIAKAGEITEQVFTLIRDADVVIADVSGGNPNVMYELGLRHTISKVTIPIGEFDHLPFDIAAIRTLKFSRTPAGLVDARKKLEAAIQSALAGEFDAVTATRLWSEPRGEVLAVPVTDGQPEELEPPASFELLATMEASWPELTELVQRSASNMQRLASLTQEATARLHKSDAAKLGFGGRLRVANEFASELAPIADEFENLAASYEEKLARIDAGMTCLVDMFEESPDQLKDAPDFPAQLASFVTHVRGANDVQNDFAQKLQFASKVSKPLRIVTRRITDATRRVTRALALAEVWSARMQRLVERENQSGGGSQISTEGNAMNQVNLAES